MHIVQSDNEINVLPEYDAKVFKAALTDGRIDGCTIGTNSNRIFINPGALMMCGRCVIIDSVQILTPPAGSGYVKVRINVGTASTPVEISTETAGTLITEDINNGGAVYDMIIASYNSDGANVSVNESIKQSVPRGSRIYIGTAVPDNSLGENGDIYIQY